MDETEKLLVEVAERAKHVHALTLEQGEEISKLRSVAYRSKVMLDALFGNNERNLRYIIDEQISKHDDKKGLSRRELFMLVATLISTLIAVLAYMKP